MFDSIKTQDYKSSQGETRRYVKKAKKDFCLVLSHEELQFKEISAR
jgi:hypothetical protein